MDELDKTKALALDEIRTEPFVSFGRGFEWSPLPRLGFVANFPRPEDRIAVCTDGNGLEPITLVMYNASTGKESEPYDIRADRIFTPDVQERVLGLARTQVLEICQQATGFIVSGCAQVMVMDSPELQDSSATVKIESPDRAVFLKINVFSPGNTFFPFYRNSCQLEIDLKDSDGIYGKEYDTLMQAARRNRKPEKPDNKPGFFITYNYLGGNGQLQQMHAEWDGNIPEIFRPYEDELRRKLSVIVARICRDAYAKQEEEKSPIKRRLEGLKRCALSALFGNAGDAQTPALPGSQHRPG